MKQINGQLELQIGKLLVLRYLHLPVNASQIFGRLSIYKL